MFRSDLDAALQRADALQRELDSSRVQTDQLQRELANARAQLAAVESADVLQRQLHRLGDQLASTQQLLAASENERQRLEALVPPPPVRRVKREPASAGGYVPARWAVWSALVVLIFIACTVVDHVSR